MQNPTPQQAVLPVCPHCGQDPANFSTAIVKINGGQVTAAAVYCANAACRKLHSVQIMDIDKPRVAIAR